MYDEIASGYNELHKEEQMNKLRIIKDNLDIKKNDLILDVGCGTAFSLDMFNGIGIDPSLELLKQGKGKLICGRAENLPFADNSFDFVISITAIHNFMDIETSLLEMKRVGKKLAFSVLKRSANFELIQYLIEKNFDVVKKIEEDRDMVFIAL